MNKPRKRIMHTWFFFRNQNSWIHHEIVMLIPKNCKKYFKDKSKGFDRTLICLQKHKNNEQISRWFLCFGGKSSTDRMWLEERPVDWIEKPLHDEKVLVWYGISCRKIYGSYFFEESLNQYNYLEMLKNFFLPENYRVESHGKYYFQQDGSTPHTTNHVWEPIWRQFYQ